MPSFLRLFGRKEELALSSFVCWEDDVGLEAKFCLEPRNVTFWLKRKLP